MNPGKKATAEIGQIMGQALAEQTRRFTYCLIDNTGETKVGTAVAIQLGDRFFLATTAHLIENAREIKALVREQIAHGVSDFVAKYYDNQFDVGLLEISSSDSHYFEFLSQASICETIEDEQKLPVMVVGFPGQFCKSGKPINLTAENLFRVVRCESITFNTHLLPRSEWPSDGLPDEHGMCKQLIDGCDMIIDYQPEHKIRPFTPKTTGTVNPPVECSSLDPRGISGGGIWWAQTAENKEGFIYPDTRLIGLQLGWHPTRNWLRGIRVRAWLDFVRKQYPDLRNVL